MTMQSVRFHRTITHRFSTGTHWLRMLLLVACAGVTASPTFAVHPYDPWAAELGIDPNVSYDGIRVMTVKEGSFEMTERRAPGKMYTEMHVGGMTTGVILREDLSKSYILMPSMGFYREDTLASGLQQSSNGLEFSEIEKVGTEDVNGHPSTKYRTSFSDKNGKGSGFVWVTDTGVPIKIDMVYAAESAQSHHMTMTFKELNLREQDPAYFELPPNLKPMNMGAAMGNLGQFMGMGAEPAATPATASTSPTTATSPTTDTLQDVTNSVTEGTKGLIKGIGIGGLFGMGEDEPAAAPENGTSSSGEVSSDALIQSVQNNLKTLGYDPGNTNGETSMQTSIAISQFQAEKGLEVTGEVTPQLAGMLEAEVEKR